MFEIIETYLSAIIYEALKFNDSYVYVSVIADTLMSLIICVYYIFDDIEPELLTFLEARANDPNS